MNRFILLIFNLTVCCNTSGINSTTRNKENTDITEIETTDTQATQVGRTDMRSDKVERFDDFFYNYTNDSIFQFSRTKFPVELQNLDFCDNYPTSEKINEEQWRFLGFDYHNYFASRKINAYTQTINYGQDTTKLQLRGVDNGISIDFNFVNRDGRWFLISIKDFSN